MKSKIWIYAVSVFVLWTLSPLFLESSEAALCTFRNPDKDVYVLFPEATGYRTVIKVVDEKIQKKVEEYLGQELDFDEVGEHTFYLVLKGKEVIGIIRPHAERGKYGIVEIIWAFTTDGGIIDFKIQRSREKGTNNVKNEEFRRQFRAKTIETAFTEKKSKKLNAELFKPAEKAERLSSLIAYSAKKNLFLYSYFFPEYNKQPEKAAAGEDKKDSKKKSGKKDNKK
ncbi:MAG: hypothetical protein GWP15_04185 [Nitrospirae bacterium]|nr:hypothetical protein [Nitrospirota bacterium]